MPDDELTAIALRRFRLALVESKRHELERFWLDRVVYDNGERYRKASETIELTARQSNSEGLEQAMVDLCSAKEEAACLSLIWQRIHLDVKRIYTELLTAIEQVENICYANIEPVNRHQYTDIDGDVIESVTWPHIEHLEEEWTTLKMEFPYVTVVTLFDAEYANMTENEKANLEYPLNSALVLARIESRIELRGYEKDIAEGLIKVHTVASATGARRPWWRFGL